MATIRTKFRSSSAEGREGALYYQVIHNRVVRQISTGYKLFASEWDQRSEAVIPCQHPAGMERDNYLLSVGERIRRDKIRLEKAIRTLSQSGPFTADDIVIRFHDSGQEPSFNDYIRQQIVRLKRLGKIRTSETYTAALKSFSSFMKGSDILFGELSSDLLMEYEAYLKNRGNSPNTISFYMRILKAVYNRAVENGLTGQRNLFKSVYTGVEKTLKRAIHLNDIRRIKRLDLSLKPHLDFARDMFLFCFYTRGMSFVDMAYLKKGDIANGILTYRRKKTGQQLTIKWEKCMEEIVTKYEGRSATQYLLPIITNPLVSERVQYTNALSRVNVALKEVARLVDLQISLTMYCARHGWASVAKSKNIPLSVISEGMGHDSEETTRIYLASLDTSVVDRANSLILKDL